MRKSQFIGAAGSLALLSMLAINPALAQEAAQEAVMAAASTEASVDVQNIFNTLLFLMGGFLVMWMAAGFAMLEAGLVRSKNVSMQCVKNIGLFSIAGIMYWLIGYNLMYSGVDGGYFGTPTPVSFPDPGAATADPDANYAAGSDWFFQMVFCATTASIVSGTIAERVKIVPVFLFVVVLTGVIYPVVVSWEWGGAEHHLEEPVGCDRIAGVEIGFTNPLHRIDAGEPADISVKIARIGNVVADDPEHQAGN